MNFFADDETTKVLNLDIIQYGKNLEKLWKIRI